MNLLSMSAHVSGEFSDAHADFVMHIPIPADITYDSDKIREYVYSVVNDDVTLQHADINVIGFFVSCGGDEFDFPEKSDLNVPLTQIRTTSLEDFSDHVDIGNAFNDFENTYALLGDKGRAYVCICAEMNEEFSKDDFESLYVDTITDWTAHARDTCSVDDFYMPYMNFEQLGIDLCAAQTTINDKYTGADYIIAT